MYYSCDIIFVMQCSQINNLRYDFKNYQSQSFPTPNIVPTLKGHPFSILLTQDDNVDDEDSNSEDQEKQDQDEIIL